MAKRSRQGSGSTHGKCSTGWSEPAEPGWVPSAPARTAAAAPLPASDRAFSHLLESAGDLLTPPGVPPPGPGSLGESGQQEMTERSLSPPWS